MLTTAMRTVISDSTVGLVASIGPDGRPNLSPKGTMVVLDEKTIAFANVRSPGTTRNVRENPAVELNFVDIFSRKACRVRGLAAYIERGEARFGTLMPYFNQWPTLQEKMRGFILVDIEHAAIVLSPIYETGLDETTLRARWLSHFQKLMG
jgi:predicted pyridoxine 5'-phosphate oxidase superfamily flavin-nucleotide-binding protein